MAVFSQNINQLSGDTKADIQMIYDHIRYMEQEIERVHGENLLNAATVSKNMAAAAKALAGEEGKTNG